MASSSHKLRDTEAKQILVQLNDGSTWKAEIRGGETFLVEQLTEPTVAPKPQPEPQPEPMESDSTETTEADTDDYTQAEEMDNGYEPDEQETYEDMFEQQQPPRPNSLNELFKNTPNVTGMPDSLKEKVKDPAFRARLSSIMLDNKYDRKLRGRTRGKLDMGRLSKVPMMQRNIFTKKQSRRGKNYNVILLVDQSGSMSGAKSKQAAEAGMFLLNNFDGININTCVIGFHDSIHVYKDWNSKKSYDQVYKDLLGNYGGNEDYDAMHFALDYFKKAPDEGENILLMLSDGAPTLDGQERVFGENGKLLPFKFHDASLHEDVDDDYYGNDWKNDKDYLHHLVKSYPDVNAVGIGIFEGGWQVPEHFVIHSLEDLKPTIIRVLGHKIKRG